MTTADKPDQHEAGFPLAESEYARSLPEAKARSEKYRDRDPFPNIPRALLSSEHIKAYVREIGMIHPFHDGKDSLKSASYEVGAGGRFIFWTEDGKKIDEPIKTNGTFTLRANSISYVQIDCTFLLPEYIAVRFNLRITHVHRGLLLGTGPLVDPGFCGTLLVPLHNLTSDDYTIRGDEGLIWMEFTKTSLMVQEVNLTSIVKDEFNAFPAAKSDKSPEYYFDRASKNQPIRSSIPVVVADAKKRADEAVRAAEQARLAIRILAGVGVLAVLSAVIGLFSLLNGVNSNVMAAYNLIKTVSDQARQAASDAKTAAGDTQNLRSQLDAADVRHTAEELQRIRTQLDDARVQIEALKVEIRNTQK
jgi:deoxycytidine triphosphate deaminase